MPQQYMEDCVWYVIGDPDKLLWKTKEDAEKWARHLFPTEDPDSRYQRIFYRHVYVYTG